MPRVDYKGWNKRQRMESKGVNDGDACNADEKLPQMTNSKCNPLFQK
jgi:hypothetical protein